MIKSDVIDGVAILTLMHGKANALDIEFCHAIADRFVDLGKSDAKAVVLTGQGKAFSAGVDLKRLTDGGVDYVRKFLPSLHKLYDAVFFHPKAVVAAVNGHAIAGGAVLVCCADRRIMARGSGRIGVTELQVGVPFPALAFEVLRFAVPPRYLPEFALGAATYETDAAVTRGWVDEAVAPEALADAAMKTAQQFAAIPPTAFTQTKIQIRQAARERLAASGEATDKVVTRIWTTPATLDHVRAYVARTLAKS